MCDDLKGAGHVSIHAPAWGATAAKIRLVGGDVMFQSTHPVGCDGLWPWFTPDDVLFQSTHPRGVRPMPLVMEPCLPHRFNPRTRVGCDDQRHPERCPVDGFNPRTRVGCDRRPLSQASMTRCGFNPRTRVGCDLARDGGHHGHTCFNPRTRVGCDCPCQPFSAAGKSFNPRTRVGCDVGQQPVATVALVSIHAPAWGATGVNLRTCKHHEKVSIHAPAWGATSPQ